MAKTYLELVNIVLRDINEVPLSEGTFTNARGIQSFVKEALNRSLLDIINYNDEWPFMANGPSQPGVRPQTHTFNTVSGVSEYMLPSGIDQIDWDNILMIKPDNLDDVTKLEFISYNTVTRLGLQSGEPSCVYQTPSRTYIGLHPRPTKIYNIEYTAWKEPVILDLPTDTLPFEDRYYPVLVSRARYYLWMFRENSQQASIALNEYEDSLRGMFRNLVNPDTNTMMAV